DFLLGTFLPFARASESPIAIACFLLFTVLPLPPLLSVPALRRFMAPFTSSDADLEYRAMMFSPLQSRKRRFRRGVFVARGALAFSQPARTSEERHGHSPSPDMASGVFTAAIMFDTIFFGRSRRARRLMLQKSACSRSEKCRTETKPARRSNAANVRPGSSYASALHARAYLS